MGDDGTVVWHNCNVMGALVFKNTRKIQILLKYIQKENLRYFNKVSDMDKEESF